MGGRATRPRLGPRLELRPRLGPPRVAAALAACLAIVLAGCSYNVVVTQPPPTSYDVPIGATPWPNGTVGKSGLRISPSLLSNIPLQVGGSTLIEDAQLEIQALDDPSYAASFTAYYAARVGQVTDPNWLVVTLESLKDAAQNQDFYTQWRDGWFATACSQADGLASSDVETINDWQVDVGHCTGGVDAYVLNLANGVLVSLMDLGPRRLGHELIQAVK